MKHDYTRLEHYTDFSKDHFVVSWTLFNVCNYKCSYCVPGLNDGSIRGPALHEIFSFIDLVFKENHGKKIYFEFGGGEITYHKYFKKIFEFIKSRGGATGIISNGSRPITWWEQHIHLLDHLCLSYHSEQANQMHFYDLIKIIEKKVSTHVNLMMLPQKFQETYDFAKRLALDFSSISIALQPILINFTGPMYNYSHDELSILKEQNLPRIKSIDGSLKDFKKVYRGSMLKIFEDGRRVAVDPTTLVSNQENGWFGWDCMTGVENIVVEIDGSIYRGYCRVGNKIGSFLDPNFNFPSEPILCFKKKCTCIFDIMSSKSRHKLL
jgi:sulfatase maturation enzyme AslB (radical SAM superfamily)